MIQARTLRELIRHYDYVKKGYEVGSPEYNICQNIIDNAQDELNNREERKRKYLANKRYFNNVTGTRKRNITAEH